MIVTLLGVVDLLAKDPAVTAIALLLMLNIALDAGTRPSRHGASEAPTDGARDRS